jgi:acyl phosphate:glycerol-3-phosphate acyltransferase
MASVGGMIVQLLLPTAIGYLLGSIPFGFVLSQLAGLGDIRRIGSGNVGATNVLRTGSKGLAALTLILDLAKGAAAVAFAARWGAAATLAAACAAVLGHVFPIWLGFRGGKGVATGFGVLIVLVWPAALAAALAWLCVAALFRYSSLAALVAAIAAPICAAVVADPTTAVVVAGIAALVALRHHANIRRLIAGTESQISFKKG